MTRQATRRCNLQDSRRRSLPLRPRVLLLSSRVYSLRSCPHFSLLLCLPLIPLACPLLHQVASLRRTHLINRLLRLLSHPQLCQVLSLPVLLHFHPQMNLQLIPPQSLQASLLSLHLRCHLITRLMSLLMSQVTSLPTSQVMNRPMSRLTSPAFNHRRSQLACPHICPQ